MQSCNLSKSPTNQPSSIPKPKAAEAVVVTIMVVGRRRKTSSSLLYTVMARALIFNGHFRFPLLFLECVRGCKGVCGCAFVVFPGQGHRNSVKHDMRKEENFIFISRLIWDVFFLLLTPPLRFPHLSDFFAQTFLSRERKREEEEAKRREKNMTAAPRRKEPKILPR